MALLLILTADSQTQTGVLGTGGGRPGAVWVAAQEDVVVGTLMKDSVVVAGAPADLTTTFGQMMTFQVVVREDQTVRHPPAVAARPMVGVVARHPSVTDPPPLVNVHRHTVVAVARPLAAGTEASVARASHAVNQGTEHQTARTSRRRIRSAACLPRCSVRASSASDKRLDKAEHNAKEHRKAGLPCVSICDLHMPDERLAVLDTTTVLCGRRFTEEMIFLARC